MLYFVGGASRAGKTTIAREILGRHRLPYVSLDWLMMGFNDGIPEYGIHHLLFPDEIAERMWPFLKAMCESMLNAGVELVIEGEAILPELISELVEAHPTDIRICFVGYADIDVDEKFHEIRAHSDGQADWLADKSDDYVRDHIRNMIAFSRRIRADCNRRQLPYFETSTDFTAAMEAARNSLGLYSPVA